MTMNKLISVALSLTVLAAGVPAMALDSYSAVGQPNGSFLIPQSKNGVDDIDGKWSLPSICRVDKSSTCVQCLAAGAGFLTDLEVDSGVAANYASAFDSITTVGESATTPLAGTIIASQQTAPAASTAGAVAGHSKFDTGRPFFGGLVLCANSSDTEVIATYRVLRK